MTLLPPKLEKRIAGRCQYCAEPAIDGSDYCEPHDAHVRGQAATRQKRYIQRRAAAGRCIEGCGTKVKKRRKPDGHFALVRCAQCKRDHKVESKKRRKARGVTEPDRGVTEDDDDSKWRVDPGTTWNRYRGKGRRGRLTREEQAAEDKRNAMFAIEALQEFIKRVDRYVGLAPHELSPVQRNEAKRQTGEPLGLAGRFIDELVEHYG